TYTVRAGGDGTGDTNVRDDSVALLFHHAGEAVSLRAGETASRAIRPVEPMLPRPKQPVGREPIRRPASQRPESA
ncbi:MAG TPA: hypothetical protein VIL94_09055, partial [Acidothermaceae bacterium]